MYMHQYTQDKISFQNQGFCCTRRNMKTNCTFIGSCSVVVSSLSKITMCKLLSTVSAVYDIDVKSKWNLNNKSNLIFSNVRIIWIIVSRESLYGIRIFDRNLGSLLYIVKVNQEKKSWFTALHSKGEPRFDATVKVDNLRYVHLCIFCGKFILRENKKTQI